MPELRDVTLSGMMIFGRLEQNSKALLPMVVTLLGMFSDVALLQ